MRRSTLGKLLAPVLAAGLLVPTAGAPAHARVADPIMKGAANPGVLLTTVDGARKWVLMTTTHPTKGRKIWTASKASGPWTKSRNALLTKAPRWMRNKPVWAPSVVQATDGRFHVYYAGVVKNKKGTSPRCIGTGVADRATGPFVPDNQPIACFTGSGTRPDDLVKAEGKRTTTFIDATPAILDGQYYLLYKTGYSRAKGPRWHTTTRLLQLDPANPSNIVANPRHADGRSVKITDSKHRYIEENPVLVKRGKKYTLFTSFGWYGTCNYWTRYRQHTNLWKGWLRKKPTRLPMRTARTCGSANAQVTPGVVKGSWRYWFNGHPDAATKGGPDGLYVGRLTWSKGKPSVRGLIR